MCTSVTNKKHKQLTNTKCIGFNIGKANTKKSSDFQVDFLYYGGRPMDNFVCLYGIESPGITSSMAIAELVCDKIAKTSIWFTCEDVDSAKEWLNSH